MDFFLPHLSKFYFLTFFYTTLSWYLQPYRYHYSLFYLKVLFFWSLLHEETLDLMKKGWGLQRTPISLMKPHCGPERSGRDYPHKPSSLSAHIDTRKGEKENLSRRDSHQRTRQFRVDSSRYPPPNGDRAWRTLTHPFNPTKTINQSGQSRSVIRHTRVHHLTKTEACGMRQQTNENLNKSLTRPFLRKKIQGVSGTGHTNISPVQDKK